MTEPHSLQRVTVFVNSLNGLGGVQRATLDLFEAATRQAAKVSLVYAHSGDLSPRWDRLADDQLRVRSTLIRRGVVPRLVPSIPALRRHVRSHGTDWVYVHALSQVPLALCTGRPITLQVHDPPPAATAWKRFLLERTERLFFVSEAMRVEWASPFPFAQHGAVLPNGIAPDRVPSPLSDDARANLRRQLGAEDGEAVIGFVGRDVDVKGLPVLIDAVGILATRRRVRLAVAAELRDSTRAHARSSLGRSFTELGYLDRPWDVLAAADVVAVPSRREPFGLVALEALACGVPVVASAVGGLVEILSDLPNSLVDPGDPDTLATTIAMKLDAPREDALLRALAAEYSWEEAARTLLNTQPDGELGG